MNEAQKQQLMHGAELDPVATRRLIEAFQPPAGDVVAPQHKRLTLDLIDQAPQLFANRYNYEAGLNGHMTSQAIIWNPDLKKIALLRHGLLGVWLGPGGHIDPGDPDIMQTAARESREELGLTEVFLLETAPFDIDIHHFPARKGQPHHQHYDVRWLMATHQTELTPEPQPKDTKPEDLIQVGWFTIPEAREKMGMWGPAYRLIQGLEARFGA